MCAAMALVFSSFGVGGAAAADSPSPAATATEPISPGVDAACGSSTGAIALTAILIGAGVVPTPKIVDPNALLALTAVLAPACAAIPAAPTMRPYAQCSADGPLANPAVPTPRPGAVAFETDEATRDAATTATGRTVPNPLAAFFAQLGCQQAAPRAGTSPADDGLRGADSPSAAAPFSRGGSPIVTSAQNIALVPPVPIPTENLAAQVAAAGPREPRLTTAAMRTWRWALWLQVVLMAAIAGLCGGLGRRTLIARASASAL